MRVLAVLPVFAAAVLGACNNPFGVLPASIDNVVDTVEMFAVNGTDINKPSGYILASRVPIRLGIDVSSYNFDFIYRIGPNGTPQFVPYYVVAPGADTTANGKSGFLPTTDDFDAITDAQQTGYVVNAPQDLVVGQTMYARSGLPNGCFLSIPYYAKLQVISIDRVARSVRFRVLVDINCGYRGLQTGIPSQ